MKLIEHLSSEQIRELKQIKTPKKKKKPPTIKKDSMSKRDWEDIMGVNRDIYTRRNGAWRRK